MEAAVLDEDRAGLVPGDGPPRDKQAWDIRLERLGVVMRPVSLVELDASSSHQVRIRTITGQQEHGIGRNLLDTTVPFTTTDVGRISVMHVLNRAAIDSSLMRLSMSGRTQYLIVDLSSG